MEKKTNNNSINLLSCTFWIYLRKKLKKRNKILHLFLSRIIFLNAIRYESNLNMRALKRFLCSIKFTVAFLLAIMSRVLILSAFKVTATRADITRSIKHAHKSISWFLDEASFSRELLLWKMITLSKAFVISTQFRETPGTHSPDWYSKSLKIYKVPLMKFPAIAFFYVKERTMNGDDRSEREDRAASIFCVFRVRYTLFSTWRRIARPVDRS